MVVMVVLVGCPFQAICFPQRSMCYIRYMIPWDTISKVTTCGPIQCKAVLGCSICCKLAIQESWWRTFNCNANTDIVKVCSMSCWRHHTSTPSRPCHGVNHQRLPLQRKLIDESWSFADCHGSQCQRHMEQHWNILKFNQNHAVHLQFYKYYPNLVPQFLKNAFCVKHLFTSPTRR